MRALAVILVALAPVAWAFVPRAYADPPTRRFAARAGWAYGLGAELEYRPGTWGVGVSGGYVPDLGPGGYAGVQWGLRPLACSSWVAEAGVFRGVKNPLRIADTGVGVYILAGYAVAARGRYSVRGVIGGGLPLGDAEHPISFELLAKLTAGFVF